MFFNKSTKYDITTNPNFTDNTTLIDYLLSKEILDVNPHEYSCVGVSRIRNNITETINNLVAFRLTEKRRMLQSFAVNQIVQNTIWTNQEIQGRSLGKTEIKSIKDEVIFNLLPVTNIQITHYYCYADLVNGDLIVGGNNQTIVSALLGVLPDDKLDEYKYKLSVKQDINNITLSNYTMHNLINEIMLVDGYVND